MSGQLLTHFPNFAVFKDRDIAWMINIGKYTEYRTGEILLREGQEIIDTVEILLEGALSIGVSPTGNIEDAVEIERVTAGEVVEFLSFIDNRPPSSTCTALEPSRVLSLPRHLLIKKLENDTEFAARFYQMLSIFLSKQLRKLTDFLIKNKVVPGEPLRKVLFVFAILNDADIDWMIARGVRMKVHSGTVLIEEGQPPEALYILLDGKLGIFVTSQQTESGQKEIATSVKGEILGEMSFVEMTTASATVKAAESAVLLALPKHILMEKLKQDTGFTARFYRRSR